MQNHLLNPHHMLRLMCDIHSILSENSHMKITRQKVKDTGSGIDWRICDFQEDKIHRKHSTLGTLFGIKRKLRYYLRGKKEYVKALEIQGYFNFT